MLCIGCAIGWQLESRPPRSSTVAGKCFGRALGMGTAPQPQATTPSFLLPAANYTVFKLKVTYPRRHEGSRCDIRLRHHLHLSWHQLSGCLPPIPLPQEAKVSMHTRQPGDVLSLKQSPSTRGPMGRVCPGWGDSSPESPDTPTPQAAPCSVRPISALLLQA